MSSSPRPSESSVQDHSSQYYDLRYRDWGAKYHVAILQWLMQHAEGKMLDVGCGTGFVTRLYGQQVVGVDISLGMLEKHPGVHYQMDACNLLFKDASYDFILCRSLLHHLPDHQQALREMHRVLKPGGKIAFWETNQAPLAQVVRKFTQHGDRFSEYHHAFQRGELLESISQAGFIIDEWQHQGFLAYPLFGFPDIANIARWLPMKSVLFPLAMGVDTLLSKSWFRGMSFALGVQAHRV